MRFLDHLEAKEKLFKIMDKMTYRVNQRSVSNYELNGGQDQESGQPYLHYVHSGPQSSSVANIQQLTTLSRQQQQQQQQYYESDNSNPTQQTEMHRYSQNADRFTNSAVRYQSVIFGKFGFRLHAKMDDALGF